MTKQDRQKISILVVLLAVLGLTIVLGYRMNQPQTTSAVQAAAPNKQAVAVAQSDPSGGRILLEKIEKEAEETEDKIGTRNIFQYQQTAASAPTPGTTGRGATSSIPKQGPELPAPVVRPGPPPGPPQPPPPPPINLKYQGFAQGAPNGGFTAFVSDDSRHYNVVTGEILLGRFRIISITEKNIEVEDLEYNRKQTLPLLK